MILRITLLIGLLAVSYFPQSKRAVELTDIMKFKQIKEFAMSENGSFIAVISAPDRGNRELSLYNKSNKLIFTLNRVELPIFSSDGKWLAVTVPQDFFEKEKKTTDKYIPDVIIIDLQKLDTNRISLSDTPVFSKDSKWLFANQYFVEKKDSLNTKPKPKAENLIEIKHLKTVNLTAFDTTTIYNVTDYGVDSTSSKLYYGIYDTLKTQGGLFYKSLVDKSVSVMDTVSHPFISSINIDKNGTAAYVKSSVSAKKKTVNGKISFLKSDSPSVSIVDLERTGWNIPSKNKLSFSEDGKYLFFGLTPNIVDSKQVFDSTIDKSYSIEYIQSKREIDLWHWDDPLIKTQEKKQYKQQIEKLYTSVYDIEANKIIPIADSLLTDVSINKSNKYQLLYSNIPYRKEVTWDDYYYDVFVYNLESQSKSLITSHILELPKISPVGDFAVYYKDSQWYLFDFSKNLATCVTKNIQSPFYNEDNDIPSKPASYGVAGWVADSAVLVYDKFDVWEFGENGFVKNLTLGKGREGSISFRILKTDSRVEYYDKNSKLLLSGYSEIDKSTNLYSLSLKNYKLEKLTDENIRFTFKVKAKNTSDYIYAKESYNIYPDLWRTDESFKKSERITNCGSQCDSFYWSKSELIAWKSTEGVELNGVLIKPTNYEKGKPFPLIVYFYELFSQRLHDFTDMIINHRPNFAYYTSHGYGVFLPDVRFKIGEPGMSAVRCIVPGVQKLIDSGLVDAKGVGLIGHSWSGYQTAYMISQTDMFSAAVAGAPVGNMTSAYSGIRNESGMARQFQYEKQQSRIGGSLWEFPEKYVANSPIFSADKIHTPLLIEHGDEDEAVPFQQGVELYMAMRRLNKVCYFLQYRGEPHHPKKYPNKLDYTIKTKNFFDCYLKHEPMADWMKKPTPYSEDKP